MKQLGLLKFEDLYQQQCLLLTHDCFYKRAPKRISDLLSVRDSQRYDLRGNNFSQLDLLIPVFKSKACVNSFSLKGAAFWNNIDAEFKQNNNREHFKRAIKKSLLNKYEHKSDCSNPRCRDRRHHI